MDKGIRKQIAQICCDNCTPLRNCGADDEYCSFQTKMCDQILKLIKEAGWRYIPNSAKYASLDELVKAKGYVQLDKDQSLPINLYDETRECADEDGILQRYENREYKIYNLAQQDMLKAGFRKVKDDKDN